MQLRKTPSFWPLRVIAAVARAPRRLSVNLWYRLYNWADTEQAAPLPDKKMAGITPREASFKELSFTFSLIALAAHIARADGTITPEKYVAFRDAFPLMGGMCGKLRSLFAVACASTAQFTHYVNQIKFAYPRNIPLFMELVDRLFRIAAADGTISPAEELLLARVAHMLELSAGQYSEIRDRYAGAPQPHRVLGVHPRVSPSMLKQRYRDLMRRYHPDRFAAQDLSPEVEMLLRLKASEINDAYKVLSKKAA